MNKLWFQAGYDVVIGGTPGRAGRATLEIQQRYPPPRSLAMQVKVQSYILGAQEGLLDRVMKPQLGFEPEPVSTESADAILAALDLDAEMTP